MKLENAFTFGLKRKYVLNESSLRLIPNVSAFFVGE